MPNYTYVGSGLTIPSDRPTQGLASLQSRAPGTVKDITVHVTLQHEQLTDVRLWLQSPAGTRVLLSSRRGHSAQTVSPIFDDKADVSIVDGRASVTGRYRPERPLSRFAGEPAAGEWRLIVEDLVAGDGGTLASWSLELNVEAQSSEFEITLRFLGDMAPEYRDAFTRAAARWSEVIVGDIPSARLSDGTEVDDVLIYATVAPIDGASGILGQAGPTHIRWATKLPIAGSMEFDSADMAAMRRDGSLVQVITHEMGHVLGFGTLWHYANLIQGSGTSNPLFVGEHAMAEYARIKGLPNPTPVPIESDGGPGTAEGHWSERTFDDELMTGWLDSGTNPLSRLTVASLADLGYRVDMSRADAIGPVALKRGPRSKRCHKVIRPPLEAVF